MGCRSRAATVDGQDWIADDNVAGRFRAVAARPGLPGHCFGQHSVEAPGYRNMTLATSRINALLRIKRAYFITNLLRSCVGVLVVVDGLLGHEAVGTRPGC